MKGHAGESSALGGSPVLALAGVLRDRLLIALGHTGGDRLPAEALSRV
jgi:hypothetical protein